MGIQQNIYIRIISGNEEKSKEKFKIRSTNSDIAKKVMYMEKKNIYQKLCYVQLNLKAPKSQYNRFGNYNYRNCEDIQEALKPLLKEMSAALVISDELIQVGEWYYIKATVIFFDADTGESISNTAYAREEDAKKGMDVSQVTGSTSSYTRKYALNGLFCIDDTKDADTLQGQKELQGKNPEPSKRISEQQANMIFLELRRTGVGKKQLLRQYRISDICDMTDKQFEEAMKILKGKPNKPAKDYRNMMPPDNMEDSGLPGNTPAKQACG